MEYQIIVSDKASNMLLKHIALIRDRIIHGYYNEDPKAEKSRPQGRLC